MNNLILDDNKEYFVSSDLHIQHHNILGYCNRPYKDVDHMNESLILNWNSVVNPDDTIFVIGDMMMGRKENWKKYITRLNGFKVLVRGNHDGLPEFMKSCGFDEVYEDLYVEYRGNTYWMNHYPLQDLPDHRGFDRGKPLKEFQVALNGHVHDKWKWNGQSLNVGVDVWNYTPITLQAACDRFLHFKKEGD